MGFVSSPPHCVGEINVPIVDNNRIFDVFVPIHTLGLDNITLGLDDIDSSYYFSLSHRNSIETWSAVPIRFNPLNYMKSYDMSSDSSSAYGNNLIQVQLNPNLYAIYSGDVNQDDFVDAADVALTDNDALNFVTGFVVTDLTGDEFVDVSDLAIADNNAYNFVGVIRP